MHGKANVIAITAVLCGLFSCSGKKHLFERIQAGKTGIQFSNTIPENDSINILDIDNLYNGGGVGVGDFNNDGLQDLYFTGSLVSNKMYLNKGNFQFEDITQRSGTTGNNKWCRGVAVIDINNDGWLDLYICATLKSSPADRQHLLFINQGTDSNGYPKFREMAREYGLADTSQSTQAAFFDYDNDGDLDVYIANNVILKNGNENRFLPKLKNGEHPNTDKLYRCDWNDSLKHPVFTNVSREAGILIEGYAHAVNIADINKDGWKDIYVSNDFLSNDLLWINNHDGTFTESLSAYFKHTSQNAMGSDIIDINNDGLADVITMDMNPPDNYRKKMMLNPASYLSYQNNEYYGYNYQYVRNTLQLNLGPAVLPHDSLGPPVFAEIGYYAGIAETDWSWTPVVADFDNDGYRDMIITNGFPKDVTDHDFIAFRDQSVTIASKEHLLSQIPVVKIHNYAFHNKGNLQFEDVTDSWGINEPSFSNGAVYVDLDNDGDLDCVMNNINEAAFVFRNHLNDKADAPHWLNISFQGPAANINGIGAWAEIYYQGKQQVYENSPYRGYLSSVQNSAHFGLGANTLIDSVVIKWPNREQQVLRKIKANQNLVVKITDANVPFAFADRTIHNALFSDVTDSVGVHYIHRQKDVIDFNIQRLLPHKLSEYGPALAAGDINGDGTEDFVCGADAGQFTQVFLQNSNGQFVQRSLLTNADSSTKRSTDAGLLLFDADGDGDLDLYVASGGYNAEHNSGEYQDHLYINDGKGIFNEEPQSIPQNHTSKLCVRAADIDGDGDLDLFVSGRVDPWNYPKPVSSFIYRNDSKNGVVRFTDVTNTVGPGLRDIGMVCDALFTDADNDGWPDLILAGEWMPLHFFRNNHGIFKDVTDASGTDNEKGWWNSLTSCDIDNDGDMDYIAGNAGLNSYYRADHEHPVGIIAKDFDHNGKWDAFPTLFLPGKDGTKKEFLAHSRDEVIEQLPMLKSKFIYYNAYANATVKDVFPEEQLKGALQLKANNLSSGYFRNDGNFHFTFVPLPAMAQWSVLNAMVTQDVNGDGNSDLLINTNDYGTDVSVGRMDALNGLVLLGDGTGKFIPQQLSESGFYVPGNGKALVSLHTASGHELMIASQNKGPVKVFQLRSQAKVLVIAPREISGIVTYLNGKTQRCEFPYGSSFLSQSARTLNITPGMKSISLSNGRGATRTVRLNGF